MKSKMKRILTILFALLGIGCLITFGILYYGHWVSNPGLSYMQMFLYWIKTPELLITCLAGIGFTFASLFIKDKNK